MTFNGFSDLQSALQAKPLTSLKLSAQDKVANMLDKEEGQTETETSQEKDGEKGKAQVSEEEMRQKLLAQLQKPAAEAQKEEEKKEQETTEDLEVMLDDLI